MSHDVERHVDIRLVEPIFTQLWLELAEGERVHQAGDSPDVHPYNGFERVEHFLEFLLIRRIHVKVEGALAGPGDVRLDLFDMGEAGLAVEVNSGNVITSPSERLGTGFPETARGPQDQSPARSSCLCMSQNVLPKGRKR